jgi:hypothetical protein
MVRHPAVPTPPRTGLASEIEVRLSTGSPDSTLVLLEMIASNSSSGYVGVGAGGAEMVISTMGLGATAVGKGLGCLDRIYRKATPTAATTSRTSSTTTTMARNRSVLTATSTPFYR